MLASIRSPLCGTLADPDFGPDSKRYEDWNKMLFAHAKAFVTQHQDYTTARPSMSSSRSSASTSPTHPTPFSPLESPTNHGSSSFHRHTASSSSSNHSAHSTPGNTPVNTPDGSGVIGDTSVFVFSSWNSLLSVLDYPEAYDFDSEDVDQAEGPIWYAAFLLRLDNKMLKAPQDGQSASNK